MYSTVAFFRYLSMSFERQTGRFRCRSRWRVDVKNVRERMTHAASESSTRTRVRDLIPRADSDPNRSHARTDGLDKVFSSFPVFVQLNSDHDVPFRAWEGNALFGHSLNNPVKPFLLG